jgi:acetylornithine/N-succinyldiaminopimelate aminotransferase
VHVPYGDLDATRRAMGASVAAVVVEPVQGEGGVLPAPPGFLSGLKSLCESTGALFIADEIQTGLGRTGTFLACDADGVRPDVVALAKGLGGGVPIGAMLCRAGLSEALPPGAHGSTFGGNPLASAAALAVLETLESEQLIDRAAELGRELSVELENLAKRRPAHVEAVRGKGLLQAVLLREHLDVRTVLGELQKRGVLLSIAGGRALRFSPPLVVSGAELREAVAQLDATLAELSAA